MDHQPAKDLQLPCLYPLVIKHGNCKSFLNVGSMKKKSINGWWSIAMFDYRRVVGKWWLPMRLCDTLLSVKAKDWKKTGIIGDFNHHQLEVNWPLAKHIFRWSMAHISGYIPYFGWFPDFSYFNEVSFFAASLPFSGCLNPKFPSLGAASVYPSTLWLWLT